MLVQADLYDAGWQQHLWGENVLTNLEQRKLKIDRDVPVHGVIEPFDQMVKTIKAQTDDRGHELTVAEEGTMVKRSLFVAVLACACAANAAAQDAKATIGAVSKALGADALKTVQYSATGFDYALGQNPNASAPWPKFIEKSYTRGIDFEATASRVDRVRLQGENPPRGGGQQPIIGEQSLFQCRERQLALGAATGDLDDAARVRPCGGRAQCHRRPGTRRREADGDHLRR